MTTRETILAELEAVPEQELDELLQVVRDFKHRAEAATEMNSANGSSGEVSDSIFDKLLKYSFKGPKDLSENFELYASGEKRFDDDADVR